MPFDAVTHTVLEHFTTNPSAAEDAWYGPWITILTTLFPTTQGYIVTPQCRLPDDPQSHIPDLVIEVVKMATAPLIFQTVLIVEIKNSQHWKYGIPALVSPAQSTNRRCFCRHCALEGLLDWSHWTTLEVWREVG